MDGQYSSKNVLSEKSVLIIYVYVSTSNKLEFWYTLVFSNVYKLNDSNHNGEIPTEHTETPDTPEVH